MKHARPDYDRIQDPASLIPEDEPVFLIRGQDRAGAATVRAWAAHARLLGASDKIVRRRTYERHMDEIAEAEAEADRASVARFAGRLTYAEIMGLY